MKMKNLLIIFLILFVMACGSGDVGTVITRPKLPALNLFPDFDAALSEEEIGASNDTGTLSAIIKTAEEEANLNIFNVWNEVVLDGSFADIRSDRNVLETYGEAIASAIEANGLEEETPEELTTITLSEEQTLVDTTAVWEVQIKAEEEATRFYFVNTETGLIQATYLVITDDEGNPEKGLFAYVNPDKLSEEATEGKRLLAIAYDFSGENVNLFVMRTEAYTEVDAAYHAQQIHEECQKDGSECTGEFLQIQDEERTLDDIGFQFTWNTLVCLADVSYTSGALVILETYEFDGPEGPNADQSNVTVGSCTPSTPSSWGTHVFTEADLIDRFNDTDPAGGTAKAYYGDGTTTTTWDTLTSSLIDTWLDASAF